MALECRLRNDLGAAQCQRSSNPSKLLLSSELGYNFVFNVSLQPTILRLRGSIFVGLAAFSPNAVDNVLSLFIMTTTSMTATRIGQTSRREIW